MWPCDAGRITLGLQAAAAEGAAPTVAQTRGSVAVRKGALGDVLCARHDMKPKLCFETLERARH